eukprot:CAMPEP_0177202332 /NCGR_PEP_ID=MMETSP0367-20130122/27236_1 /TAXON_ID=447022 ORGANISM="Scrippsiella hangoei-like, Strain SHHI-4" /NCGR_SAMPLE_ID=MMETSP0367 /ASSEMBLY_ACC=CAM_ASM_000362 /LENGTH=332 /DNA_ID=CAMNT_0018650911 /DNA_START=53 /DNA_END=1053 /DNA_ORIENTATION=+
MTDGVEGLAHVFDLLFQLLSPQLYEVLNSSMLFVSSASALYSAGALAPETETEGVRGAIVVGRLGSELATVPFNGTLGVFMAVGGKICLFPFLYHRDNRLKVGLGGTDELETRGEQVDASSDVLDAVFPVWFVVPVPVKVTREHVHAAEQVFEVDDAVVADACNDVGVGVQQHQQAIVHLGLEVDQGKIIVIVTEGVLELDRDEVQCVRAEDRDEDEDGRPEEVIDDRRYGEWRHQRVQEQQQRDQLNVRKRKLCVRNLLCVQQVHITSGNRLVHAGQDRSRDLDGAHLVGVCDQRLHQVQQHLDLVEFVIVDAILQMLQRCGVQACDIDDL